MKKYLHGGLESVDHSLNSHREVTAEVLDWGRRIFCARSDDVVDHRRSKRSLEAFVWGDGGHFLALFVRSFADSAHRFFVPHVRQ